MYIDLFKYLMKLSVIPMLFVSLVLITHGSDDSISGVNILGFVLLILSSIVIFNVARDEDK